MLNPEPKILQPETIPLTGRHLIEASAGTGKTFNITRIYLRLLLESALDVKQILVMTFTRAATEELRGRIAKEIRNALENWENLAADDNFFASLTKKFSHKDVQTVLHNALLHMDEAAIVTIHGFCKRILTQQAFSSGVFFNMQMETDTRELEMEAVRDWYRLLAYEPENYRYLAETWETPEKFYTAFKELLSSSTAICFHNPEKVLNDYNSEKSNCLTHLLSSKDIVFSELIDNHKQKQSREQEWEKLLEWLKTIDESSTLSPMPKQAGSVFNANRFPKKDPEKKQLLIDLFAPLKKLKKDSESIGAIIKKAHAYQLAIKGIEIIRSKLIKAKQNARLMNYDDLINQLAYSLSDKNKNAGQLAKQIGQLYPVALVDEFQDTDPLQYDILNCIYSNYPGSALFMIGDPKQAIYAFRNGDVFTYLSARKDADYLWFMDTNWRSSNTMVNACNQLFSGSAISNTSTDVFGFNIQYQAVKASGKTEQITLPDSIDPAALQLIYFPSNEKYCKTNNSNELKQEFCTVIASWCSSEINRLLSQQITIGTHPLQESDIAVLVRDKREAGYIQEALSNAGYSSVYLSSRDNVFKSEEARQLNLALTGILEPENERAFIAALASQFFSCDSKQLYKIHDKTFDAQDDQLPAWEDYKEWFYKLREIWFKRGFMAMALQLIHQSYKPHPQTHERSLTNTIQLLELLQQASQTHKQAEQLLGWFDEQINSQINPPEAELRLESDANLIRIITQHGSKGLEYPIVFIPFSSRYKNPTSFGNKNIELFKYHHRDNYQLEYFIGNDKEIIELYKEEAWAESIRLLYVALTRSIHRCYLCTAPFSGYYLSPLGRTLKLQEGSDLYQSLRQLSDNDAQSVNLHQIHEVEFTITRHHTETDDSIYSAATFSGRIERNWWLSSFSSLSKNLRHGGISSPDRDQNEQFEADSNTAIPPQELRFELGKGAATGNLLHDILEHLDFCNPDWHSAIQRPLMRYHESLDNTQTSQLIDWLDSCLNTPLNVSDNNFSADNPKLNQLVWSNTLRECEFYFPMQQVKLKYLTALIARHRAQKAVNNNQQSDYIQLPAHNVLQGMMHGFIDLIFNWQGKFYIVDYKSTHLGNQFDHYCSAALDKNIRDNYYDLQYLIYSLAMHRYLKSRIKNYDPEQHFGGVYYLYLRGMRSGQNSGVYYTALSSELLNELDNLFSASESVHV